MKTSTALLLGTVAIGGAAAIVIAASSKKGGASMPVVTPEASGMEKVALENGGYGIVINDPIRALAWAKQAIRRHGMRSITGGRTALTLLARMIVRDGYDELRAVKLANKAPPNDEEWSDILRWASDKTWGDVVSAIEAWHAAQVFADGPVGGGEPTRPTPEGASMYSLVPEGAGQLLQINNARDMLSWAIAKAKKLDINSLTSGRKALDKLAGSLTRDKIANIAFTQLPNLGRIPWGNARDIVGALPWSAVVPMAREFVKGRIG